MEVFLRNLSDDYIEKKWKAMDFHFSTKVAG